MPSRVDVRFPVAERTFSEGGAKGRPNRSGHPRAGSLAEHRRYNHGLPDVLRCVELVRIPAR